MPSVCLYFQIHQPYRLRRYSVFESTTDYFDAEANRLIMEKVAEKCYRPALATLLSLIQQHNGHFRLAFSITGLALMQMKDYCPDVIDLLRRLVETRCVEMLNETSHHSLAFIYSRDEFRQQINQQKQMIGELFGVTPTTFRNTELIYSNDLAGFIRGLGEHNIILAEGADHVLKTRTPNVLYHPPQASNIALLLKNYKLSDDVAFRFSNYDNTGERLTPAVFARNIAKQPGESVNLFMDFETFGEHQWQETGIFDFLNEMPGAVLRAGCAFKTPGETVTDNSGVAISGGELDVPHMTSWADTERDITAWLGNAMQSNAAHELYKLEEPIKSTGDSDLIEDWRKLTTSDHLYYMCTKYFADGEVHQYFNPYQSPYDSYINYMNVLDNLRSRTVQNV